MADYVALLYFLKRGILCHFSKKTEKAKAVQKTTILFLSHFQFTQALSKNDLHSCDMFRL
jgi:hypothetical protein